MNLLRLSETVINIEQVQYVNLYLAREKPMIQVVFAGENNFVNLENPDDIKLFLGTSEPPF